MAFPCAIDVPLATSPPAISSRQIAHSCFAARNAKTRKSGSRFAGFVSGPICPVDFIFMTQPKEQIKNFFSKKPEKVPGRCSA
jgi:hypothetical protein